MSGAGLHLVDRPAAAAAPLVVLVHGAMDRSTSFRLVITRLRRLHVVAYDRRGYGRSRHLDPAESIDEHVDDLVTVLDGRPAVVVGHSIGGDIALAAAARHPELVLAVAAYEPPMPWQPWWPSNTAGSVANAYAATDPADAAERFMRRMIGDERWERLPERTRTDRRAEGRALIADLRSIRTSPPFDPAAVRVPVVTGCGTRSREHQRESARFLADRIPDAELYEIDGGTHGSHASDPDAFADFVFRAAARAGVTGEAANDAAPEGPRSDAAG